MSKPIVNLMVDPCYLVILADILLKENHYDYLIVKKKRNEYGLDRFSVEAHIGEENEDESNSCD